MHADYLKGLELGRAAFVAGINAAPALDSAVMANIPGSNVLELLDGWNSGWHAANVEAPVL